MANPNPVPLALVVLRTELNARRRCSSLIPWPVSLNSTATCVGWARGAANRSEREVMVSAPPSGHGFRRVENQVEKGLLQLRRRARHRGQIGFKLLRQFDVLVLELVPDQQTQAHQSTGSASPAPCCGSVVRAKSRICSTMRFRCSIFSSMIRASFARGSSAGNFRSSEW